MAVDLWKEMSMIITTDRYRCLTDDLNCAFEHCANPIGWCLPKSGVDAINRKQLEKRDKKGLLFNPKNRKRRQGSAV